MTPTDLSPLGRAAPWPDRPAPDALFPIARAESRVALALGNSLPFSGVDVWTCFELSWLDRRGKPEVAIAELCVPAHSPNLIESKSLKLYLGSLQMTRFARNGLLSTVARDLSTAAGAPVDVRLHTLDAFAARALVEPHGESLDGLAVDCDVYAAPDASILTVDPRAIADETLTTSLFRSVCPVTAQPDFASVAIRYRGPRIDRASLLRYLVAYRDHAGFHEACVERMFVDIARALGGGSIAAGLEREAPPPSRPGAQSVGQGAPCALTVDARFTRRGGIDINPYRSTGTEPPVTRRAVRQ